jgi:choline monooxygenase
VTYRWTPHRTFPRSFDVSLPRRAERSPILPEAYYSEAVLALERSHIFCNNWLFAGFVHDLEKPNNYITREFGGVGVVVHRAAHGLVAFRNVCSHRHAELLCSPSGNSPLRCQYHGWTYDDQGYPTGLPGNREDFCLDEETRRSLSLRKVALEVLGPFVFVHVGQPSSSLAASIGSIAGEMERWGTRFTLPFCIKRLDWRGNWKTGVENTLESYHAGFVHGDSLAQVILPKCVHSVEESMSSTRHAMHDKSLTWWRRMTEVQGLELPDEARQGYVHYFVYPNLCIGLTFDSLLSVQTFEPTSASSCRLEYRLLLPDNGQPEVRPAKQALQTYLATFNDQVLDEDRGMVEACQRGYRNASGAAVLGASEERVLGFQRRMLADLGKD